MHVRVNQIWTKAIELRYFNKNFMQSPHRKLPSQSITVKAPERFVYYLCKLILVTQCFFFINNYQLQ